MILDKNLWGDWRTDLLLAIHNYINQNNRLIYKQDDVQCTKQQHFTKNDQSYLDLINICKKYLQQNKKRLCWHKYRYIAIDPDLIIIEGKIDDDNFNHIIYEYNRHWKVKQLNRTVERRITTSNKSFAENIYIIDDQTWKFLNQTLWC